MKSIKNQSGLAKWSQINENKWGKYEKENQTRKKEERLDKRIDDYDMVVYTLRFYPSIFSSKLFISY